ncbi:MAG: hypothetical protein AAF513_02515 [Pseudomonadota bacterium]
MPMLDTRTRSGWLAGLIIVLALAAVAYRGGLIAWLTFLAGVVLLLKVWRRPAGSDLIWGLGLALVPLLVWVGTFFYVIAVWESGEVVELNIPTERGVHQARLWVLDIEDQPTVYYDAAPPAAAASLLAGTPLRFTRAGEVSTRSPAARGVADVSQDEVDQVFATMQSKYAGRDHGAVLYYLLLGRVRSHEALLIELPPD